MKKGLITIFIFLSFITQTIMEPGTNAIFSRLTYSDLFGAVGLALGFHVLFRGFIESSAISKIYHAAIFLVLCFFAPIFFSYNLQSTLVECIILLFLTLISVSIYQLFKDELLTYLFPLIMYSVLTASFLGFYDLVASMVGLPRLFPARTDGEALSGFRNAGQAGAYYLVILTILIPLRFSQLYNLLSPFYKKMLNVSLVVSLIFIFLTGKIAAYVGLVCGIIFYVLSKRNLKSILSVGLGVIFLIVIWFNLDTLMPDTHKRISTKYNARVIQTINNESNNDFVEKNYGAALQAFEDRPLIGSGIGAFDVKYNKHEVHSTYLKMLGETGIIGTIGYIAFVLTFMRLLSLRVYRKSNPYSDYLANILPFILGCFISWAYTYHLRKREFWILVAVVLIVNYAARKYSHLTTKVAQNS